MVRNTNDRTANEPYLRADLNASTWGSLPEFSNGPRGDDEAVLRAVKAAGFEGVQGAKNDVARRVGLSVTGSARVNKVGETEPLARQLKDQGCDCGTLHVGWGVEADDEVDRLVDDVLGVSAKLDLPLYIETHRATITQDLWRTVQLTRRFPGIRFNGDFSHWYTGLEMVYGGIEMKLDFIAPVFERVRFIHGRIGNPGCMQVDIGADGTNQTYVDHFREMWTRSFVGFLRSARPGDYICFAPELIGSKVFYARAFKNAAGEMVEEGDRWQQGLVYTRMARECFAEAKRRVSAPAPLAGQRQGEG
jgi:hypothetical protein